MFTLGDVVRGILSTVTDTTNEKVDISEAIDFLSPWDVPFLDMIGQNSLKKAADQVKHEWLEDDLMPSEGTINAAYVAGSGSMTLSDNQGGYLYPDDLILVGEIVFRVISGAPDADVLQVTVVSGTDAAIASGSTWRRIAHSAQEGGSARNDPSKVKLGRPYNYTQILKDWIIITGTMEVISRYGYSSERAYQEAKTLKALAISLEKSLLYGVRSYVEGPPRKSTMGGLYHFVYQQGVDNGWDNVTNLAGADITQAKLDAILQTMWENGAQPDFLLVTGTNKRRITSWGQPFIRTEREARTFGASIGQYESDFGTIDILLQRWMRPSDMIIGTRGQMGIGPLSGRAFSSRLLPSTIDGTWWEILGEYTMEVHRPSIDWHWISNSSTTIT